VKAAGLDGLRFRDLRHHAAMELTELGLSDKTVMSIAGHVSREMLSHYSHIRFQAKRNALDQLGALGPTETVSGVPPAPAESTAQAYQMVN